MGNEFYISAGLSPIDNSTGATANTFYISAGLAPNDSGEEPPVVTATSQMMMMGMG